MEDTEAQPAQPPAPLPRGRPQIAREESSDEEIEEEEEELPTEAEDMSCLWLPGRRAAIRACDRLRTASSGRAFGHHDHDEHLGTFDTAVDAAVAYLRLLRLVVVPQLGRRTRRRRRRRRRRKSCQSKRRAAFGLFMAPGTASGYKERDAGGEWQVPGALCG